VRLGAVYLAGLEKQFGGAESALAAYNAGEDRVTLWTAGQAYRETAEFVTRYRSPKRASTCRS